MDRIKAALELNAQMSVAAAIEEAREMLELDEGGPGLPSQADALLRAIGI